MNCEMTMIWQSQNRMPAGTKKPGGNNRSQNSMGPGKKVIHLILFITGI